VETEGVRNRMVQLPRLRLLLVLLALMWCTSGCVGPVALKHSRLNVQSKAVMTQLQLLLYLQAPDTTRAGPLLALPVGG
jgi:hypothetical protein